MDPGLAHLSVDWQRRTVYFSISDQHTNASTSARIYTNRMYASGAYKNVWEGYYTEGVKRGERFISKGFKSGSVVENDYYDKEPEIFRLSQMIIDAFNTANIIQGQRIILITPTVWIYREGGSRKLFEPLMDDFQKFNSNTGWTDTDDLQSYALQALSHFSYHLTNGQSLLCDLQGSVYPDRYELIDPVIMSQESFRYGPSDLGPKAISNFFYWHHCGLYCKPQWIKPSFDPSVRCAMQKGTVMRPAHT
ncbi:hypothetical protein OCU04_012520 [Sclerotinia nivalis]|uniref:Alpha-type protein kinase domain-containing protein n=1 Tax=Sclerotinia nivalis TaxID=352851 RepID=A0A9X0A9Z5_9HELO|nr:hypothetical protein OCU04_012520 [Sclerotinia nivalis]